MWLTIVLVTLACFLLLFYRRRCSNTDVFVKMGIPGPKPGWLIGNYDLFRDEFPFQVLQNLTKKYGKTYGIFEGPLPVIVTSDLDLLQEVFIKQFSKFHGRKNFPLDNPDASDVTMLATRGHRWKRLRTIVNPTFSLSKLKQMFPDMNDAVSVLMEKLRDPATAGKPFDIYSYYQRCTLEVIGHCALGMNTQAQRDENDTFLSKCRYLFTIDPRTRWLYISGAILPELKPLIRRILGLVMKYIHHPWLYLKEAMNAVIDQRRSSGCEKRVDLLQLLLDAEDASFDLSQKVDMWTMSVQDEEEPPEEKAKEAVMNGAKEKASTRRVLSKEETCSQGLLFLLAGYETTSTTLAYATYLLAKNPEVQEKLIQEVDQQVSDELTYTAVQNMEYLHMVLEETLRLYPVASSIVARRCMEPCTVNGLKMEHDVVVQANVWSIHRDPDIWQDPLVFNPDRFSSENKAARHPMAWLGFGAGPRNCVGLRFAMLEAKMAICRLLKEYRIHSCTKTPDQLPLSEAATIVPSEGLYVTLSLRNNNTV